MRITKQFSVIWDTEENSILSRAWKRWVRDIGMVLCDVASGKRISQIIFKIEKDFKIEKETYRIVCKDATIHIVAGGDLGIIYALLFLSEHFLKVHPFWFWNDQTFIKKEFIEIKEGEYSSSPYQFNYRGWFINDEVLIDAWGEDYFSQEKGFIENQAFEMAMEALLRLGGNLVIPGTDQNSHKYMPLATDMGLYITHHHAEPLGAQMFARAYPDLVPSYALYPELFEDLWRKAIQEQKGSKVIWSLGFRGQGDRPFWMDDRSYDTPKKRGELISSLIKRQYDILCDYVEAPVCCTNLYGEVMELYNDGYIHLPDNIIYIWADNGYGKMVTRRNGNHNPRIRSLPTGQKGMHGCYYHASFYDLQAASHITMMANSMDFVENELRLARDKGIDELIMINCSNVRPHTYTLDKLAQIWGKKGPHYTERYFTNCSEAIAALYCEYAKSMPRIGPHDDDHAGDQFYHYTIRAICHGWLTGRLNQPEKSLNWLSSEKDLIGQVRIVQELSKGNIDALEDFFLSCKTMKDCMVKDEKISVSEVLFFEDSLLLQSIIHFFSMKALIETCTAFELCIERNFEEAFYTLGLAIENIDKVLKAMSQANHDKWHGFYDNDCLTDVSFSNYSLRQVMGYIRNLGDGPHFYMWQQKYVYPESGNKVILITNMKNHCEDWEIFEGMKRTYGIGV